MSIMTQIQDSKYLKDLDAFLIKFNRESRKVKDLESIKACAEAMMELIVIQMSLHNGIYTKQDHEQRINKAVRAINSINVELHYELFKRLQYGLLTLNYQLVKEPFYAK